jgi:hypothetical protein
MLEKIPEIITKLQPYWKRIENHFNQENERFKDLFRRDHNTIGRILKNHLIVEIYVNRYLIEKLHLSGMDNAKLTFFQKAMLLPEKDPRCAFVRPGIIELNAIRNKLSHSLLYEIRNDHILEISHFLEIARKGITFTDKINKIESFTPIACTFLVTSPEDIDQIFSRVFRESYR